MTSETPKVSVVMTVFNGGTLVRPAIRSILEQTLKDLELIVIDDGSTDHALGDLDVLEDCRVHLVSHRQHVGRARCLNQGVRLARGELVAIMDADDLSFPERLERQWEALAADADLDVVGSRILRTDGAGGALDAGPDAADHDTLRRQAWRGVPIPHPTWCGRRRWFELHPYRSWLRRSEDQELLYRAVSHSRYACLSDVLVVKRESDLPLPTLFGNRVWQAAGQLAGDVIDRRWRRAALLATQTAGAAVRFVARGGHYDHTWRWTAAEPDVGERYERLLRTYLGTEAI